MPWKCKNTYWFSKYKYPNINHIGSGHTASDVRTGLDGEQDENLREKL
jgi:hypothetical protein